MIVYVTHRVCLVGGLWCGVLCGCGLAWLVGVMVFDVCVVWMGGSVLGPVWVRVCLAVCAFVCFPFVFWWGVLRVIDKKTRAMRQADTHTRERCEHRARGPCFMQPGRVLGVRPFILVGVHYQRALCVSHPLKE